MPAKHDILVIGPSWVGDMVMAQSLFAELKQRYPESNIDVLAPEWTRPLLARMPEIREAISMPVTHGVFGWKQRRKIGLGLQHKNMISLSSCRTPGNRHLFRGLHKSQLAPAGLAKCVMDC